MLGLHPSGVHIAEMTTDGLASIHLFPTLNTMNQQRCSVEGDAWQKALELYGQLPVAERELWQIRARARIDDAMIYRLHF